jgi:hypothetical protein
MKNIFYIIALIGFSLSAQVPVMTYDSAGAAVLKGNYGQYSALDPVALPNGLYILPTRILQDQDLADSHTAANSLNQGSTTVEDLPDIGEPVTIDIIYKYTDETGTIDSSMSGLVIAMQNHDRTIYPPYQTPDLFSFFRENSDTLTWIPNEFVHVGWKRVWEGITYEQTAAAGFQTLPLQTPDLLPALWTPEVAPCSPWVQPTGAQDAYNIGDCVEFEGEFYVSNIDANVWSPAVTPQFWDIQ